MRSYADLYRALSDETRLRIVAVLSSLGELCSCDIETGLEVSQSRASRHLGTLRQAGIVVDRRDGAWVYYQIAEPLPPVAAEALAGFLKHTSRSAEAKRDVARTKKHRRSPCCE